MATLPDPHNVRDFVNNLTVGTRVIWIANGTKGLVQPDKSIRWDDGSLMTPQQMNDSHALLIHSEAEWKRMNQSLSAEVKCLRCGCTVQRWDHHRGKGVRPEEVCPIAVLSDPEPLPMRTRPRHLSGTVRLAPPRIRRPASPPVPEPGAPRVA